MYKRVISLLCLCALLAPPAARAVDMSSVARVINPKPGGRPWARTQIAALRRYIDRQILTAPTLRGSLIGLLVIDTVRGTVLYSKNAEADFIPASNFKLLVGSAALRKLGKDFTFVTRVAADAPPADGVIHGNLYLRGGGDALLKAKDLDDAAAALAMQGLRRVDGALVTDESHYDSQRYGLGWSWDDIPFYYTAVISALELEDGVVHATMTPGSSVGAPVRLDVWPQTGAFTIENRLTTGPAGSKDTSDLVRPWDAPRTIVLSGSYPLGSKTSGDIRAAVPDPAGYAGDVFLRALQRQGIVVDGGIQSGITPSGAQVLWAHQSAKLPELLADFWYPSDNLIGELFLKELGVAQAGEPGTDANGIVAERRFLKSIGVDSASVDITDGSGLSHYDHITPADLVKILQADWNSPYRDIVLDALPVPGVRGTMRKAYTGTPVVGNAFLKDGVISNVRTLSGFVKTKTHGPITFSWQINSWMGAQASGGRAALAKLRAKFLSHLVKQ